MFLQPVRPRFQDRLGLVVARPSEIIEPDSQLAFHRVTRILRATEEVQPHRTPVDLVHAGQHLDPRPPEACATLLAQFETHPDG